MANGHCVDGLADANGERTQMASGVAMVGVAAVGAVAAAAVILLRWALRCSMVARQAARKGNLEFAAR